jgi:hypothetical protein
MIRANGRTLITESDLTAGDGRPAHAVLHRQLSSNGKLLVQTITLTLANGHILNARRVFRKS